MFALLFIIRKKNLLKSTKLITKVKVKVINTESKTKLQNLGARRDIKKLEQKCLKNNDNKNLCYLAKYYFQ